MALVKEMYSANGINRIYQLLRNEADNGTAKEYDIKVDALKVVSRNNDPERFFEHETFLMANSRNITVNIYDGSSPRCTRYMLLLCAEEPGKEELSGIEKTIHARMQQERKSWEYDRQKQEIVQLRQELMDAEKYSETLKKHIVQMNEEKQKMPGKLTETLISLAGAYISRNPNALNGIPVIGNLLGAASPGNDTETVQVFDDTQVRQENNEPEEQVTFSKIVKPKYTGEATDEDFDRLENALIPLFAEEYRETVSTVISVMYHDNEVIQQIAELLPDEEQGEDQKEAA